MNDRSTAIYDAQYRRIERLYQELIALETAPALERALAGVLHLLTDVTQCELAYLEVLGEQGPPVYWLAYAQYALPPGTIHSRVPRDLFRQVMQERKTLEVERKEASARWRGSTTALCAPLGGVVPIGVLYMEGATSFASIDRDRVEAVAGYLARIPGVATPGHDQTLLERVRQLQERCVREELGRHRGNISEAARALGVGRAFIYRVLGRSDSE